MLIGKPTVTETAKTYKKLQQLIGPLAAAQLDTTIGLTLTRTRAISAASIAKEIPAGLASRPDLEVEIEPLVQQDSSLQADFTVTIRNSRYFYDIQIVAISKDSAKEDPYSTLKEAASEKRRKYQSLGAFFHPLIFSAGGLIDQETSQTYKKLQELLGPFAASQLDSTISLTLTKTKAILAASIA
ncbi:hypothetical protein FOTG_16990 [Fusarium oxysporum f. sp. vasinfectum 25433]|uniref:Uncharacterized protein n=1 Tax=Fusarium oxysporum f. sp. vasinfectum 25433 TaxID=1089449 RepID=X0L110_FUSOX|nr:hypothetical protein FOTG_16990 [Fusarium oxysporum f. sp. vasinfectum 25433]